MRSIIDVDNKNTWPQKVRDIVNRWSYQCAGSTEYTSDLPLELEYKEEFLELLSGYLLRGYHCTRLLPNEVKVIGKVGLRPLTNKLLDDRTDLALKVGYIDLDEANTLKASHVFATGDHENRENQVCLVLSRNSFIHYVSGCEPLLGSWGGEGIYLSSIKPHFLNRLTKKSKPTIVEALLDFSEGSPPHLVFPALHKVFVGSALGLSDVGADVFYKSAVTPDRIERILQAGDEGYKALGNLPES